tara:strand:+ start:1727 stop:4429 length:2703 start_codon:yes stop_codon:yes gene_type:complete
MTNSVAEIPAEPSAPSALKAILDWATASQIPEWQQDALRRLITQESVTKTDAFELECIARNKHNVLPDGVETPTAEPLTVEHIPTTTSNTEAGITIGSISELKHVNRLPSDQTLSFDPQAGLNVVYGKNGTGKSGYARVLKKACRTRGQAPNIKADVFSPKPTEPASAKIQITNEATSVNLEWVDGEATHPGLSNIFVFDTTSAQHYLSDDDAASFTPFGLDVLPRLVRLCDYLSKNLNEDLSKANTSIASYKSSWPEPDTTTRRTLLGIDGSTDPESIRSKATEFTDALEQQLSTLVDSLSADPIKIADQTLAKKTRLDDLANLVKTYLGEVDNEAVSTIRDRLKDQEDAQNLLSKSKSTELDNDLLTGTGNEAWKALYDAAKLFSNQNAYPDHIFPDAEGIQKCLLCQTSIDDDTRKTMQSFRLFVEGDAQTKFDSANIAISTILSRLNDLDDVSDAYKKSKADLDELDTDLSGRIKEICDILSKRSTALKSCLTSSSEVDLEAIEDIGPDLKKLTACSASLEELEKKQRELVNKEARQKTQDEVNELQAQKWLSENLQSVLEFIEQSKLSESLTNCLADMKSARITTFSTKLCKQFITDEFVAAFHSELTELGLQTIEPVLHPVAGKKAQLRFGLRLKDKPAEKIVEVASEGEQRCISLAAFFAELSQASHKSALVFDDPVSSLDHTHRENIAARLAKEASIRQVIVFTHDNVFLHELCEAAANLNTEPACQKIEWANGLPGTITDGVPWDTMKPEHRIDSLQKSCRALQANWQPQPSEENSRAISTLYSDLRSTIERIIERVVFGDTVFRYREYVKTHNLHQVLVFNDEHCTEIQRLHQICNNATNAHDAAEGKSSTPPDPAELMKSINDTNTLLVQLRECHKDQRDAREAELKQA